jgi:cytochrome b
MRSSDTPAATAAASAPTAQVWDLFVRVFHWSLVLTVSFAALSGFLGEARILFWHVTGGLIAAGLVLARIVWGFLGPTHARFSDFVAGPAKTIAHLRSRGTARHLGHNPLGALMVLALIALVLALAATGLAVLGGVVKAGPLAPSVSYAQGAALLGLHEALAFGLVALVLLHLGGVVFESRRSRENLARSMLTGTKARRAADHPGRSIAPRPLVAVAVMAALAALLIAGVASQAARPVPGLPDAMIDPVYADACTECHMAYHPSLLPAASWQGVMATLDDHFGENASLDAATAAAVTGWLTANAAETADTAVAHRLALTVTAAPFNLTDARFWKRTHHDLPDALFASRAVAARSNCAACHQDAEQGLFSPFAISIPREPRQ